VGPACCIRSRVPYSADASWTPRSDWGATPGRQVPLREGMRQCRDRHTGGQRAAQRPAHDPACIGIAPPRPLDAFRSQANRGDVRDPALIEFPINVGWPS
jgi:hypothetical protein